MSAARVLLLVALGAACCGLGAQEQDDIDRLVEALNPYQGVVITDTFLEPASDIAEEVQKAAWFSFLVFLPFLVLPQVLLLVVIFKFRDRRDGRRPSTFVHNNTLEITWTLIPIVALIIVAIPVTAVLVYTEYPPGDVPDRDALLVDITGRQFAWKYEYPQYDLAFETESGHQLPVVLEKDRTVKMRLTSRDVNHAWSVPAFGVKKDAFINRWNYMWFTPRRPGFYEGHCYELCGENHGQMLISAVVLEEEDFERWTAFERNRFPAGEVVEALRAAEDGGDAERTALAEAVATYLDESALPSRRDALRFWAAYDYHTEAWALEGTGASEEARRLRERGKDQRAVLDRLIREHLAAMPDTSAPALARASEEQP